jgi:hypothetical protein
MYHLIQNRLVRLVVLLALAALTTYGVYIAVADTGLPGVRSRQQSGAADARWEAQEFREVRNVECRNGEAVQEW